MPSYSAQIPPLAGGLFLRPAYLDGLAVNEWKQIATNTLSDVDPEDDPAINPVYPSNAPWRNSTGGGGQSRVMSAWGGGAWDDSNRQLYIFGGGHYDYAGNELYAWDAMTGEFKRITKPTGAIGNEGVLDDGQEATGVYFDGQPRSVHTYNNMVMRQGKLWEFGGSQYRFSTPSEDVFSFNGVAWEHELANGGGRFGAACYDTVRDKIIVLKEGGGTPRWIDCAAKSVGSFPQSVTRNGYVKVIYLPLLDSFLVIGGSIYMVPADGSTGFVSISTTGTAPTLDGGEWGYDYDANRNRILCWFGGQEVYALTPPATDPTVNPWSWSQLSVSGVIPPTHSPQGTYGRFWYSHKMDCIGVVNRVGENMYVCPLS